MRKLKIGDKVVENDGIIVIIYTIIRIEGKKAIGQTEFEGEKYLAFYKKRYYSSHHIRPFYRKKGVKDTTIRYTHKN